MNGFVWDTEAMLPAEREVLGRLRRRELDAEGFVVAHPGDAREDAENPLRKMRGAFVKAVLNRSTTQMRLPSTGLLIAGAVVDGPLPLEGVSVDHDLGFKVSVFSDPIMLRSARMRNLFFSNVQMPRLVGDRLTLDGSLAMRRCRCFGEFRLNGSRIEGVLDLSANRFEPEESYATIGEVPKERWTTSTVNLDGSSVSGTCTLSDTNVLGEVRLTLMTVGGNVVLSGGTFICPGRALNMDSVTVAGVLFQRPSATGRACEIRGLMDLTNASVGALNDTEASWPPHGRLYLDRFRYDAITGGPTDAEARLRWLALQTTAGAGKDFWPQPYEQLAKVLRDAGHQDDAREVLIGKERLQRADRRAVVRARLAGLRLRRRLQRTPPAARASAAETVETVLDAVSTAPGTDTRFPSHPNRARVEALLRRIGRDDWNGETLAFDLDKDAASPPRDDRWWMRLRLRVGLAMTRLWDALVGEVIRYGRRPQRAFRYLLALLLLGTAVFWGAERSSALKPNNAFVLRAAEWTACARPATPRVFETEREHADRGRAAPGESQLACFGRQPEALSFPAFNPLIYSADTLLPIVDLEMQGHWLPDETRPEGRLWFLTYGWWARTYLWLHIALGWALSLLAVAGFSGLVKSDG